MSPRSDKWIRSLKENPAGKVVADEEGIVVLPAARASKILADAEARAARDATTSLDAWVANHKARIDETTRALGI